MRHVTVQQLSAFLDGALTGVSRDLVTRHLAACPDCRERHALWHIYDEVLQRVLSWEPSERTMEEASTRVELTLTAERRGLPPPEFTSVLQPMIASTPGPAASARASSLYPTLPPIAPPAAAAPPLAPAPPPMPAPAASAPAYSAPPPAPPAASVPAYSAPPPAPAPSPVSSALSYPLDPYGSVSPPSPVRTPSAYGPPPLPPVLPPSHAAPISVYDDLRSRAEAPVVPWASVPLPKRRRPRHRLLVLGAILLALGVVATPWMPDVIRIRMPESWEPRVPRVEFVQRGNGADQPSAASAPLDPRLQLAERTSSEPPGTPYRELPAVGDSAAASPAAIDTPIAVPAAPAPVVSAPPPPVAPAAPARKPKPRANPARVRPAPPSDEDETGTAGAEHSMTFIPVQVKTEVTLSSTRPSSAPAPPATDTVGDASLPLLCGEVVDESGAPIEGARVQFTSPPLTIRTDKRGRFCVACPAGERTFLVDAPGFTPITRGVELTGATFETHITLRPAP